MFGFSASAKTINKVVGYILKLVKDWRRRREYKKAQKQADRAANNPVATARSMFNDKDDAE